MHTGLAYHVLAGCVYTEVALSPCSKTCNSPHRCGH